MPDSKKPIADANAEVASERLALTDASVAEVLIRIADAQAEHTACLARIEAMLAAILAKLPP
jgi:hypothetical protein